MIFIVIGVAQPEGVKVYVAVPAVEVLIVEGLHVPAIPLLETDGSAGAVLFRQNGPIALKAGVGRLLITTFMVTAAAQFTEGVNV